MSDLLFVLDFVTGLLWEMLYTDYMILPVSSFKSVTVCTTKVMISSVDDGPVPTSGVWLYTSTYMQEGHSSIPSYALCKVIGCTDAI